MPNRILYESSVRLRGIQTGGSASISMRARTEVRMIQRAGRNQMSTIAQSAALRSLSLVRVRRQLLG